MRMRSAASPDCYVIFALSVALSWGCDPGNLIKATIREIPPGTTSLQVQASRNPAPFTAGTAYVPYRSEVFDVPNQAESIVVGLKLPADAVGRLRIEVSPQDSTGSVVKDSDCGVEYFASADVDLTSPTISVDVDLDPRYPSSVVFMSDRLALYSIRGLAIASPQSIYTGDSLGNVLYWGGCGWQGPEPLGTIPILGMTSAPSGTLWAVGGLPNGSGEVAIYDKPPASMFQHAATPAGLRGQLTQVKALSEVDVMAVGKFITGGASLPIAWLQWSGSVWSSVPYGTANAASYTNALERWPPAGTRFISAGRSLMTDGSTSGGYVRGNLVVIDRGAGPTFAYPWNQAPAELLSLAVSSDGSRAWLGGRDYLASWDGTTEPLAALAGDPALAHVTEVGGLPPHVDVTALFVPATAPNTVYAALASNSGTTDLILIEDGAVRSLLPVPLATRVQAMSGTDLGNGDVDLWLVGDGGLRFRYRRTAGRVQSTRFMPPG